MLVYRRAMDLMEADLGSELVALDAQGGNCFGFNEVATVVWRSLEQPRSFDELCAQLLLEFEVEPQQCRRELHDLLDDLASHGLIVAT